MKGIVILVTDYNELANSFFTKQSFAFLLSFSLKCLIIRGVLRTQMGISDGIILQK